MPFLVSRLVSKLLKLVSKFGRLNVIHTNTGKDVQMVN